MSAIFSITLPFFALVLCGYLAARQGVLPATAIPGLNAFVLYFALPCMLFRFGNRLPVGTLFDPALVGIYFASALVMVGFTLAVTWGGGPAPGLGLRDAAFGALVAAFPNTGFMGVPLLVALLGQAAAGPAIGVLVVDLVFTSTLCIAIAESQPRSDEEAAFDDDRDRPGAAAAFWRSLRGVAANPLPWAIGLGSLAGLAGLHLPGPLAQIVAMLGDAATPVALFTIGAVLWRAGQHVHGRTPLRRTLPVALFKLLLHPALVLAIGLLAKAAGATVTPFGLSVLVLMAALPSASNVSLLAERYGADNGRIARIVMASTVLAFGSFSLLVALFGRAPG
jgi:predicted permease